MRQLRVAVSLYRDERIAGQRRHLDLVVLAVDRQDDHGVRPADVVVLAGIQTEQRDVRHVRAVIDRGVDVQAAAAADVAAAPDVRQQRRDHGDHRDRQRCHHRPGDDADADPQLLFRQFLFLAACGDGAEADLLRAVLRLAAERAHRLARLDLFIAILALHAMSLVFCPGCRFLRPRPDR